MKNSRRPSRRSEIRRFIALEIMSQAQAMEADGRRVFHLEVGQPAGGAAAAGRRALTAVLDQPLGYTTALGLPALRRRIAEWSADRYGVDISPDRVIVTTGSSAAFHLSFLALFDAGARLGLGDPSYPSYRAIAAAHDIEPVRIETKAELGWTPTPEQIAVAGPLDGLLIASPANPTGQVLDRDRLAALIAAARSQGAAFISDEIYHGLDYDRRAVSALEIDPDAVVINSFSKFHRMTGWRLGWMIAPDWLAPAIERLQQNLYICPPHAAQVMGLGAFEDEPRMREVAEGYRGARDLLVDGLAAAGFRSVIRPEGAFYVYAEIGESLRPGEDSLAWSKALLAETGVAIAPGLDFDPVRGGATARASFCAEREDIAAAMDRLTAWAAARRAG